MEQLVLLATNQVHANLITNETHSYFSGDRSLRGLALAWQVHGQVAPPRTSLTVEANILLMYEVDSLLLLTINLFKQKFLCLRIQSFGFQKS